MEIRNDLLKEILNTIEGVLSAVIRSMDFEHTLMYWTHDQKIIAPEQGCKEQADYGKHLCWAMPTELLLKKRIALPSQLDAGPDIRAITFFKYAELHCYLLNAFS